MEGEGRAPKPADLPPKRAGAEPPKKPTESAPEVRSSFVSVDLEDIEAAPASVEEIVAEPDEDDDSSHDIEVEFEDGNVDKLLAMTGERWSIEDQQASLKEAAKDPLSVRGDAQVEQEKRDEAKANARPSLSIPTPYDFGAGDLVTDHPARPAPGSSAGSGSAGRSVPPPLPGTTRAADSSPRAEAKEAKEATKEAKSASIPPPPLPASAGAPSPSPPMVAVAPARLPPIPARDASPRSSPPLAPPPSNQPPALAPPPAPVTSPAQPASRRPPPLPREPVQVQAPPARVETTAPPPPARGDATGGTRSPPVNLAHASQSSPSISHEGAALVELLIARVERLAATDDSVGLARAQVELAIVNETLADDAAVNPAAEAALKVDPELGAAHAILRRRLHSRTQLVPMLRHLEREVAVASSESSAVELLAEKARLLEAGDRSDDARESWELALNRAPHHAAALKGLEADLVRRAFSDGADDDAWEDLVAHLGRMSDAFAAQPNLAGWLHVERARILELRLGARGRGARRVRARAPARSERRADP